jgi:3-dehydroquinate dehydratase-2
MPESDLRPVLVINGPNLNMLGLREPERYGHTTFADLEQQVHKSAADLGLEAKWAQSNHEGSLVDAIQAARAECSAIIINPAAYTHTSVALRDALLLAQLPTIELHITNVHTREEFRHHSYISPVVDAVIVGAGVHGYTLALTHVAHLLRIRAASLAE